MALSSGYERIIRLNEIVSSIKASDEIGVKYMNAYEERMHDIQEAREQGEKTGEERGRTEGLEAGIAQGEASKALEMAKAMKIKNYPDDEIAELTGLSPNDIKAL